MQVIHELRHGVKLRKVSTQSDPSDTVSFTRPNSMLPSCGVRRNIEYELTPFEILLDQIRARRYQLKKVSRGANDALGAAIKKDARDIILDFIRSRPPLKKSSQRKQNPLVVSKSQPVNLHEQLMNSIRNYSTPLRRVDLKASHTNNNNNNSSISEKDTSCGQQQHQKRLLKADKKLLNHLTSSDDVSF